MEDKNKVGRPESPDPSVERRIYLRKSLSDLHTNKELVACIVDNIARGYNYSKTIVREGEIPDGLIVPPGETPDEAIVQGGETDIIRLMRDLAMARARIDELELAQVRVAYGDSEWIAPIEARRLRVTPDGRDRFDRLLLQHAVKLS